MKMFAQVTVFNQEPFLCLATRTDMTAKKTAFESVVNIGSFLFSLLPRFIIHLVFSFPRLFLFVARLQLRIFKYRIFKCASLQTGEKREYFPQGEKCFEIYLSSHANISEKPQIATETREKQGKLGVSSAVSETRVQRRGEY